MPRASLLLIIVSLLIQSVPAQAVPDQHERILSLLSERNYRSAADELRRIEQADPEQFRSNNYDYLLARLSERTGDSASAAAGFQAVASRGSILRDYARWHLSRIARSSGNLVLERLYLNELIAFSPASLPARAARERIAQSYFDGRNYDLAIQVLERRTPAAPVRRSVASPAAGDSARRDTALLAQAYLHSGNAAKAKDLFGSLITGLANPAQPDDYALAAAVALDSIESGGAGVPELTDYEHLRRASIFQFNRDFARARLHYNAIISRHSGSGLVPDSIVQVGRGYVQQRDFTEALKWFERALEQFPEHAASEEALLQAASAYARVGKYREAVVRYKRFIDRYPQAERLDRAYLNIIDVLRDQREETEALKWAATVRDKFRGRQPEALATFAEARIFLARTDWTNAHSALGRLQAMPDLGGANTPGGTTGAEVRFLRGYTLEQLRRYDEAIEAYLEIPDGRNEYYGWRATERLRMLASDERSRAAINARANLLRNEISGQTDAARKNLQALLRLTDAPADRERLLASLRSVYGKLPAYTNPTYKLLPSTRSTAPTRSTVADELLFLGLYDEAAPELELAGQKTGQAKPDHDYTLAVFYTRGDAAHRGLSFVQSVWKAPADYQIELIREDIARLSYPTPFAGELLQHAPQRNVDPRFLLAIMRQESGFRADVKSYAAARGLMQFISTTATRVAGELQRESFRQDDLYDPATAILFGSHYTANLFKQFPHQPAAVAASYNGGEDNVARWLARSKSDESDRYVPEIVFSQSKDYVYRVMANYRMYQQLYDESLKRR